MMIVRILVLLLFSLPVLAQNAHSRYTTAMERGDNFFRQKDYNNALKCFQDAQIAAREGAGNASKPQKKVKEVFDAIQAEKKVAEKKTIQAQSLALVSQSMSELFVNNDLPKAYKYAEYAYLKDSNINTVKALYTCLFQPASQSQSAFPLFSRKIPSGFYSKAAFSLDERRIVLQRKDKNQIFILDAVTGDSLFFLKSKRAIFASPNATHVFTCDDSTCYVWNIDKKTKVLIVKEDISSVVSATFSKNDERLFLMLRDVVIEYDVLSGKKITRFVKLSSLYKNVEKNDFYKLHYFGVTEDERRFFIADRRNKITLWDIDRGAIVLDSDEVNRYRDEFVRDIYFNCAGSGGFTHRNEYNYSSISERVGVEPAGKGRVKITSFGRPDIIVTNLEKSEYIPSWTALSGKVSKFMELVDDGVGGRLGVWDVGGGYNPGSCGLSRWESVSGIYSHDKKKVLFNSNGVGVCRSITRLNSESYFATGDWSSAWFSRSGAFFAALIGEKSVNVWEVASGKNIGKLFLDSNEYLSKSALLLDSGKILTSSDDFSRIYDLNGNKIREFVDTGDYAVSLKELYADNEVEVAENILFDSTRFPPDSVVNFTVQSTDKKRIAFVLDNKVILCNSSRRETPLALYGKYDRAYFSQDNSAIVTCKDTRVGEFDVWNLRTGKIVFSGSRYNMVAPIILGKRMIMCGVDSITIWDMAGNKKVASFQGRRAGADDDINSLISPDSSLLLTHLGNVLNVWHINSKTLLLQLPFTTVHRHHFDLQCHFADAKTIVVATQDSYRASEGSMSLYDIVNIDPRKLIREMNKRFKISDLTNEEKSLYGIAH